MSLLLTTPPLVEPVSLTEAKTHLRVPHGDDDVLISVLITSARRRIETRTGLRLITQNWSQFMDCWPVFGVIDLRLNPVSAVVDVVVYGDDDTPIND